MTKYTKVQIYFYSVLTISLIWLLVLPKPLKNFAPIVFVIPTFPIFIFNFYNQLYDFSGQLKKVRPDLFKKYVVDYGISVNKGQIVDIGISTNTEFENLEKELSEKYILCRQLIRLASLSFVIFVLLGISTVYLE